MDEHFFDFQIYPIDDNETDKEETGNYILNLCRREGYLARHMRKEKENEQNNRKR